MLVELMLRRRMSLKEELKMLNKQLTEELSRIPILWSEMKNASDAEFLEEESSAGTYLHEVLNDGLSGQIFYIGRFPVYSDRDTAQSDDHLRISIDTKIIDYKNFCFQTLPKIMNIFRPYRGAIFTDVKTKLEDFEFTKKLSKESGRNINGRDSVYRIWPVCFFDNLLCQRAFGINADEVVARAAPECEHAELLHGGAFLIVTTAVMTGLDLDVMNARIMVRLDPRSAPFKGAA